MVTQATVAPPRRPAPRHIRLPSGPPVGTIAEVATTELSECVIVPGMPGAGKSTVTGLAANFIDYGFTVFMDQIVIDRAELEFLVGMLAPRPVMLVTLAPGVEACRRRDADRQPDEAWEFDGYHPLDADMRRALGGAGWWFDTSALTLEETAERVVREAARRARIGTPRR